MRPSVVTVVVMAMRAMVRMAATGLTVTAAPDGGGNVVRGASCDAKGGLRYAKGVVPRIRGGRKPKVRWLGMRVRAAASEWQGCGRDVVHRRHDR